MGVVTIDTEIGGVDGYPSAIQVSKGRNDPDDGLEGVRDVFCILLVVDGELDHRCLEVILVDGLYLKVFPGSLVGLLLRLLIHLNFN